MSEPLLTITQLAARLSLRERRIMNLVRQGKIPYVQIGRQVCFDPVAIDAWLEQNRRPATMPATPVVTKGISADPKAPDGAPIRLVRGPRGHNRERLKQG